MSGRLRSIVGAIASFSLVASGIVATATPASAATDYIFEVNSLRPNASTYASTPSLNVSPADANPGDGICATAAANITPPGGSPVPECTMMAAIQEANAKGTPNTADTITVGPAPLMLKAWGNAATAGDWVSTGTIPLYGTAFMLPSGSYNNTSVYGGNWEDSNYMVFAVAGDNITIDLQNRIGVATNYDGPNSGTFGFSGKNQTFRNFSRVNSGESAIYVGATSENLTIENGAVVNGQGENYTERGIIVWGGAKNFTLRNVTVDNIWTYGLVFVTNGAVTGNPFTGSRSMAANSPIVSPLVERSTFGHVSGYNNGHSSLVNYGAVTIPDLKIVNNTFKNWSAWPLYLKDATTPNLQIVGNRFSQAVFQKSQGIVLYNVGGTGKVIADNDFCYASTTAQSCYDASVYAPVLGNAGSDQNWSSIYVYDPSNTNNAVVVRDNRIEGGGGSANIYMQSGTAATAMPVYRNTMTGVGGNSTNTSYENGAANQNNVVSYNANSNIRTYSPSSITPDPLGDPCLVEIGAAMSSVGGTAIPNNTPVYIDVFASDAVAAGGDGMGLEQYVGRYSTTYTGTNPTFKMPITGGGDLVFRLQTTNVTTGQTSQMSVTRTKTGPDMCPPSVWVKRGGWFDANGTQTASQADPTSVRTVTFDIMVSERMADSLAANEISFAGSTALNPRVKSLQFLGGNRYRLLAMADSSGTITPSVPANKIKDPSGNWNAASNTNVAPINFAGYTDAAQTQGIAGANIDDVVQYNSPISVTTATPTVSEPGPGSPQTAFTVTTTNRPTSLISFTPVWSGLSAIAGLSPQPAADTVAKAVPNNPSLDAIRPSMTSMQTQTTLQVRPIDNTIVDGTRTVTLGFTIGSTDPEFDGLILETTGSASPATTTVTVNDNDTPIPASGTISVLTNNALNNGVATNTVQATARNSLGQLVSNALVTFATSPAGPTPIPAGWGIRSAVGGTATIAIASTTQGSFTVTAPAATNASASVNFLPGIPPVPVVNPSNGTVVAGTAVSAGTVSPEGVTITAQTSGGSPITVVCNESTHNPKNNVVPAAQTSPFAFTCTPATTLPDLAVVSVTATNIAGTSPAQVVTVHAAPAAPVVSPLVTNPVAGTTTVAGTAKPGSTITVKDGNGNPVTTTPSPCTVDGSGSYSCTIPATTTGPVSVVATDANGDSAPQTATMPVVPPAPGVVPTDGSTVSGTAAPGSTITVTDGSGNPIGTSPSPCLADATTGAYDCALVPPPADGTTIKVTATLAGQPSAPTTLVAQATAPSLAVATADGTNVVGTSSPGATITVTDAGGQPLVTSPSPCVADSSGAFACTLATPLADGAALTVTATKSGQSSQTTATVDVPINASSNGGIVTGTVLPSSAVTVKDADGTTLCTTTANATTGAFSCTPSPVPVDGATLTVLSDPPGAAPAATATIEVDSPVQASSNGTAVTGTAVPGSTVVVKDAAGNPVTTSPSPCVADPTTGAFACTLATPVADGTALTVVSQHSSGTPVYGATPIAVVTPVQATSDGTTVSGIGSPGAAIDVKKNGTTICTTTVALDGTYSCPLSTPLADGDTVSVTSTPTGGGAPSTATIAVDSLITASSSGAVVTGTALPGAVITVKDGNVTLTTTPSPCVADGSGHYACAISPAVPTGTDLTVIGTTGSGQNVQTSITTVEADPILESSSNGTSVIGTAPPGSTITVTDDHGTTVCSTTTAANGTFTCPLNPAVPDGEQLTVSASAGSFPLGTETITTDANITAQSNGSSVTGTTAPGATVEVKDANGTTLCIAQADPVTGNYSCTPSTPPAVGTVITATATDSGGTVLGQTTATVEQALMAAEGAGVVSGIASPGSTITVKDGGGTPVVCTNAPVTAAADGTFSCTLPTSPAPSGPFSVTSTSTGGQVQTVQATPANVTPITASSNGTTVTGTATPGTTVTVTDGTNTLCTATADASGGFSCTLSPAQTDGALLEITQSTGPQTPVTVTVDTFVTASATPTTVTGTAPPGSTVAVTGATATCTNPVPASGVYSCTFSPEPAVGTPVTVTATGAGSVVLGTTTTNVGAPALIAAEGVDGSGDTEITGVTTPGATVVVTDSTSGTPETCTTTAAADGTFSCTFTGVTPSGPYTVEATPAGGGTPVTAPAIPATGSTLDVDSNGTHLVGVGTPGATISVTSPAGVTLTAVGGGPCVADTAGAFNCELSPVQPDGTPLTVAQSSGPSPVSVDVDAFVTAAATTGTVTGTAPAGSVVEVKNGATTVCTIDPVPSTGVYSCAPSPVPAVGDTLTITSTSQNGDPLGVATATATQGLIASEGMSGGNPTVSGSAAPGSAITVTDGVGQPVACTNAPVTANATTGAFDCTLPIGATGPFTVTATSPGAGGLVESAVAASAFNTALNVTSNGVGITGTGTPGATISVSSPAGVTLTAVGGGACVADSVGAFNCVMSPAQPDGAALTIAQSAGPSPVSVEVDAFVTASSAGSSVTGSAAPGSEVTVKAADGTTLCTVDPVPANGIYVCDIPANLHPNDGSVLTVTVTGQGGSPTLAQTTTTVDPLVTASGTGGVITGTAVPGATVAVKNADGTVICTTTADATTGAYACTPSIGLLPSDGDVLTVESTRAGQTSTTTITADAMVDAASDGLAVTGTAPPGATIELTDAAGNPIPTTSPCTANASGMFVCEPVTPLTTGETVFVTATAGGVPTRDAITVDAVATAVSDGSVVTGVAAPGATIELTDAGGNPIPTMPSPCVASSSGSYACVPAAPIPSGTDVTVTATKNGTPVGTVTTTVASGVVATSDGAVITGTAEPGAQVVVRNASNQPICTATADSNGAFACTPAAGQRPANGETVTVVSTDSAGNQTRTPVVVETPMSATSNGATVSGTALPGSTVTVSGPNGPVCTATADSSGAFTCAATTPQADGTVLTVGATTSGGRTMQTTATVNAPMTASGDGSAFTGTAIPGSTITATGTAGSIPLVDVNGGPCVAAANGTFACMPASASDVPVGGSAVTVTATAPSGGPVAATIVNVSPMVSASSSQGDVTGTAVPGATVEVIDPASGTVLCTTTANASTGNFACSPSPAPTAGTQLEVRSAAPAPSTQIARTLVTATQGGGGGGGGTGGGGTGGGGGAATGPSPAPTPAPEPTAQDGPRDLNPWVPNAKLPLGDDKVTYDGHRIDAAIAANVTSTGLEVTTADPLAMPGWGLQVAAVDGNGRPEPLGEAGSVVVMRGAKLMVRGSHYQPGTQVNVFVFTGTTPVLLGTLVTDGDGSLAGALMVPRSMKAGVKTLQVNGLAKSGKVMSVSLGFKVADHASGQIGTRVLFKHNSDKITAKGKKALRALVAQVPRSARPTTKALAYVRVLAQGATPTPAAKALAKARAKALKKFLVNKTTLRGTVKKATRPETFPQLAQSRRASVTISGLPR